MIHRSLVLAAIVGLSLSAWLAACGGDGSPTETSTAEATPAEAEAAVEETWRAFVRALERGDGQAACAELSDRMAAPNELNRQLGSPLPSGPSCEETASDKDATLSLLAGIGPEFVELEVDGATASGIAGAAKPTFAEAGGEWELTSLFGLSPEG